MFQNLAINPEKNPELIVRNDDIVKSELELAGMQIETFDVLREGEVHTAHIGCYCGWTFKRAWRYYIAKGFGIPNDKAEEFHQIWGKQVRVDGHCGCPSPTEWYMGFTGNLYHIDKQEGLNAFARLLESIYTGDPKSKYFHKQH